MRVSDSHVVRLHVDLAGSNCPAGYRSVELVLDGDVNEWADERIRREAASHYAVPLEQVGEPERRIVSTFDFDVIRHRLFESNVPLEGVPCPKKHPLVFTHDKRKAHHGRLDQNTSYVQVTGGGNCTIANKRASMGVPWMSGYGANEAIPPAFAEFIGRQVLEHIQTGELADAA